MIARVIYEGQLGEDIRDVLPDLIKKAKTHHLSFYLLWNGVLLFIDDKATEESILAKFYKAV